MVVGPKPEADFRTPLAPAIEQYLATEGGREIGTRT